MSSPQSRKAAIAAVAYVMLAGLQRGMPLILLPIVASVLSPSEYGAASTLVASSLLITTICAASFEQLVVRLRTRHDEDVAPELSIIRWILFAILPPVLAMLGAYITIFVPVFLGISGIAWGMEIASAGFVAVTTYYALPFLQARYQLSRYVLLTGVAIAVTLITKLAFVVILRWGVEGWALSDLIAGIVMAALGIALTWSRWARFSRHDIRKVLSFVLPLIPHRASFWAITSLSRPALASVSNLTQVGLLSVGLNVASVANLVLAEANRAALPTYSREKLPGPLSLTQTPARLQVLGSLVVPGVVGAALSLVGGWIFPSSYWASFPIAGVLLVGQIAYGMYIVPMNYLVQSAGVTRLSWLASLPAALLIFLCTLAWGGIGGAPLVAWSTVAGFTLMLATAVILTSVAKLRINWISIVSEWPSFALGFACAIAGIASTQFPVASPTGILLAAFAAFLGLACGSRAYYATTHR